MHTIEYLKIFGTLNQEYIYINCAICKKKKKDLLVPKVKEKIIKIKL